jgi:hypothetical protein
LAWLSLRAWSAILPLCASWAGWTSWALCTWSVRLSVN